MRAITLDGFGGPEVLKPTRVDRPQPGSGQVLIRVLAASVNRPDIIQRQGNYPPPPGDSEIPGLEVAGVIESLGDGVDRWSEGDEVLALVGGGGYAEYVVAHQGHVMARPVGLSFIEAACVCETYITAFLNIFMLGELEASESILIHGGGGGVSTAGIQLVKALRPDARLYVTASEKKVQRVLEQGADVVIDYRKDSFAEVLRADTSKRGVNVILDHIGAEYLSANLSSLALGGRLVIIGIMGGSKAEINLGAVMVKRQRIIGSVLRSRPVEEKSNIISRFNDEVMPLFAGSRITPLVDKVFPLEAAAKAHEMMEASGHFGKLVLDLNLRP